MGFTLFVIMQKCFLKKPKFDCFKKCQIFFLLTAPTNIKILKVKFEFNCTFKYDNQFLLLKNYRL